MSEVLWLGVAPCHDATVVGGKAAALSRLAASHRVPPGFALPATGAYIESLTDHARTAIREAYNMLAHKAGAHDVPVAVRSSAVDEDGADSSFAGQHDTYLNVRGADAVVDAVQRCIASATTREALDYRLQRGLPTDDVRMAVLVQQMVLSDVSAVVFSANPVTGALSEVRITASWGLGESIVGGMVTPDTFVVTKDAGSIMWRDIAMKERMTVLTTNGTTEVETPVELQTASCLDDAQVCEAAQLAMGLEGFFGFPVDVECAFAGGTLYLLQCRPITTLR
jgi:pyruvate,water dikinase